MTLCLQVPVRLSKKVEHTVRAGMEDSVTYR